MARVEADREDMLHEATGYPRRVEFRVPNRDEVLFAGLRSHGTSLYIGPDPVFHLDAEDRLRRAFVDGDLYRTQGTTLARLRRRRTDSATDLLRHDLEAAELATLLEEARVIVQVVLSSVADGTATVLRSVPDADPEILSEVARRFGRHLELGQPLAPAIKGKR